MLQRQKLVFALLALLPTLAIYAWVRVYPIADVLRLSLFQWNLLSRNKPFVGLENFRTLLTDQLFLDAITNTTIIAFGVLADHHPSRDGPRGPDPPPHAPRASPASTRRRCSCRTSSRWCRRRWPGNGSSTPASGPSTRSSSTVGIEPKAWLFDPVLAVVCIIVLCAWQALGYAVLIFLVGVRNLPTAPYEAARIDGASALQSFRYITVPLLKPITLYVSVVTLVAGFNVYAQAFVLASDSQGAPGRLVRVLVLDMMENSFRNYRFGYAASEAVVLLAIVLVLTLIQFGVLRERGARAMTELAARILPQPVARMRERLGRRRDRRPPSPVLPRHAAAAGAPRRERLQEPAGAPAMAADPVPARRHARQLRRRRSARRRSCAGSRTASPSPSCRRSRSSRPRRCPATSSASSATAASTRSSR